LCGGSEFGGRVLFGARGARSIDRALCLIHLFVRRFRTRDCEDGYEQCATGKRRGKTHTV
jgi:hypothetical protein